MKSILHTKAALPLYMLLSFLAALFLSIILLTAAFSQMGNSPSDGNDRLETEQTRVESGGNVAITRNVVYHNKLFPIGRMRWTEDIENTSYNGYVKLIYFIYDRAQNRTTATYSGKLSPQ